MKTFFNLVQEVIKPGKCHSCGGCVTFCTAINYGALEQDENNKPRFKDIERCIECGLCYMICPEIDELDEEVKREAEWSAPMGRIIETSVARAADQIIRERGTDGGVVTATLLHLFDSGHIDGAIVTKQTDDARVPWLATSREEIIEAAGSHFDVSHGMAHFGDHYSTYSPSVQALGSMMRKKLRRVAFVGTPCQIKSIRKMQALSIIPADSIEICLGLFCSGNYTFETTQRKALEKLGDFKMRNVKNLNIKDKLIVELNDGDFRNIPINDLDFAKRDACFYCDDFSAEYADISFGGLGAENGWTTVVTRTPLGRAVFADASAKALERFKLEDNPRFATNAFEATLKSSLAKKEAADENHKILSPKPLKFKI